MLDPSVAVPDCYSIRRLNPFQGVRRVVQMGSARAISDDGDLWRIQAQNDNQRLTAFHQVGEWKIPFGFIAHDIAPGDSAEVGHRIEPLIQAMFDCVSGNHFPLSDVFEYWALDRDQQPLALLASRVQQSQIGLIPETRWLASPASDIGFPSLALMDDPSEHHPRYYAEVLEKRVNSRIHSRRWIKRQPDGQGTLVSSPFTKTTDRRYWQADEFSAYGLREHWREPSTMHLYRDWVRWTAPFLLTLGGLSEAQRKQLEGWACERVVLVANLFRLYPDILDHNQITSARVEAKLRYAADRPESYT